MSRRPSFEYDLTHSVRAPASNTRSFLDAYSYRKFDRRAEQNNKDPKQDEEKKVYESTNYSNKAEIQSSVLKRLPPKLSNMRETFAYSSSRRLYDDALSPVTKPEEKYKINEALKQTMDIKSIRRRAESRANNNLERSVSDLNLNQKYVKSQEEIGVNQSHLGQRDIKTYNYIPRNYGQQQNSSFQVDRDRAKCQQQKQKRASNQTLQEISQYRRKGSVFDTEQSERFNKKNYFEYYTPKIQKNQETTYENQPSSAYTLTSKKEKGSSFDRKIQGPVHSPKKLIGVKELSSKLSDIKGCRQREYKNQINSKLSLEDFILGKKLGHGKFGTAYMVLHKETGGIFALKKIEKQTIRQNKLVDQFILEIKLQSFLNHKFILKIFGLFDDENHVYLISQLLEQGSLFNYLRKHKKLPEVDVAEKVKYLAESIAYLQERGIAHRDIKPENIVMTNDVCKLADFGWATFCDEERRKTYCGTPDYLAPEILEGEGYDETVDLWCMGILAYELLTGKAPFYHMSRKETMKKIKDANLTFPDYVSDSAQSFIGGLIQKDPNERMSISEVLKHEFLRQVNLSG